MPPSSRNSRCLRSSGGVPSPTSVLVPECVVPPVMFQDDIRLQASFELDDFQEWWTTSSASPNNASIDSSIDSLLQIPDENQATLKGICSDPDKPNADVSPPPPPSKSNKRKRPSLDSRNNTSSGTAISPRESHILSERQRRKGMNHLFSTLASLLPESASKSDKSTIVSEIIGYIQSLQGDLENLSKRRKDVKSNNKVAAMPELKDSGGSLCSQQSNSDGPTKEPAMQASLAPNVILSICGDDAFVTMSAVSNGRNNILSRVLAVLQQHELRVVDGSISSNGCTSFHYFHVKIPKGLQVSKDELQKALQDLAIAGPVFKPVSDPTSDVPV